MPFLNSDRVVASPGLPGASDAVTVWDAYFAGIVALACHPGYERENTTRPTIEECALIADEMLEERNKRCLG